MPFTIMTKELTPDLWPVLEELFGPRGACGGCWCMSWRLQKGEKWEAVKGAVAKRRFKKSVGNGSIHGILAFVNGAPVGWCTFGPRLGFPRLERARTLQCDDVDRVWSIPCFFVKRGYRDQGVAKALLQHSLRAMKKRKAKIAEAYPVKPNSDGRYIAEFSYTGTQSLFAKAGFKVVGNREGGRQRVRRIL